MEHVLIGAKSNKIIKYVNPGWGHEAKTLEEIAISYAEECGEPIIAYKKVGSATPTKAQWEEV